jgi:hypothetical protein
MAEGPGKYDAEATMVMQSTNATCVIVWVYGGDRGEGFAVQTSDLTLLRTIPGIMRSMADQIEEDAAKIA